MKRLVTLIKCSECPYCILKGEKGECIKENLKLILRKDFKEGEEFPVWCPLEKVE